MEKYLDTELSTDEKDLELTILKLENLETADMISWIDNIIPRWKISLCKRYADEYSVLEQNWISLCQRWNTKPKYIIIVAFIPPQQDMEKYRILWTLCNRLTKEGNVVRMDCEVVMCRVCESAILSAVVVDRINRARDSLQNPPPTPVPASWSPFCKTCSINFQPN